MISYIRSNWQLISFYTLLFISFLMIARTAGLVFEADDFLLLLWAKNNLYQPWNAFFDLSMFGYYYRPMVVLAWWVHLVLFGPNPFWHQMALGVWWLSIILLTVKWGKQTHSLGVGALMGLLFLCSDSGHNVLLWKSWLTQILGIVFQLASLVTLRNALQKESTKSYFLAFVFFLCASTSKESALFCLPWVSLTFLFVSFGNLKNRFVYGVAILLTTILMYSFLPALERIFDHGLQSKGEFWHHFVGWGNFGHQIWGSPIYQSFGLIITIVYFLTESVWKWTRITIISLMSIIFLFLAIYNNIVFEHATALALFVFMLGIGTSSDFRYVLPQWVWLNLAFWPLPVMSIPMIAYGADAGVALALVLGTLLFIIWQRLGKFPTIYYLSLPFVKSFGISLLIILLGWGIIRAFSDLNHWVNYGTNVFHVPFQSITKNAIDDIFELNPQGPMYVNLDIWPETDHFLAFMLPMRYGYQVIEDTAPEGYYRLESFTNRHYHRRPEDEPVQFWIKPRMGEPTPESWLDPYYHPEHWQINILSNCDRLAGWKAEDMRIASFPLGQGQGYVALPWQGGKTIDANLEFETLNQEGQFTLTFWLHTIRWDQVDKISISLHMNNKTYQWKHVEPIVINHFYEWQRVVLQSEEADMTDQTTEENRFLIQVSPRTEKPELLGLFGIDEVRLSFPNDVEFIEGKRAGINLN